MLNANKELLSSFFTNNLQYVVPFFQRSYVWETENWETLWDHIIRIAGRGPNEPRNEHFIGTLITKQRLSENIGEQKLDLIDGQQRLTTFSILLKAIANKASGKGEYPLLKNKVNEIVVFENSKGNKFIRVEHSRSDREYFEAIMLDKDTAVLANQEHKILLCYRFFKDKLEDYSDEKLHNLKTIILTKVPVISMLLAQTDDEQEIFDTINSLGVRLTTGELLKNYIFSDNEIRTAFDELWAPVFEDDEEQINFWNSPKTSGRVVRTNIEVLLYCYLTIQKKSIVELERLFGEYKTWISAKDTAERLGFLRELKEYALIFETFPSGKNLNEISFSQREELFFHVIEHLDITTVYPLVLYIYRMVSNQEIRNNLIEILESFLVRRNVCRLTTKNYNNLFIQVISKLSEKDEVTEERLLKTLKSYTEDTNRFPTDAEFKNAFKNESISNSNAGEILYCIALYQVSDPKNDVRKISSASYSVEHMMPQKWEANWSTKDTSEEFKINRNRKLKSLGNLTLVTKNLNSSMKNSAWDKKKVALKKFSSLKITTDYLGNSVWDESQIDLRATEIATIALKIWK